MSLPTYGAAGSTIATAAVATVPWPVHQAGDIGLLIVQSANQAISLASAQGFAEVVQVGTGTGGAAGATRVALFWCRATSGAMPSPQVADPGDHTISRILTFRGCVATGNPWDVYASDSQAGADTSIELPGATTTVADCLVVGIVGNAIDTATDDQVSGWTNAALSALTERIDLNSLVGVGGGLAVVTGGKAAAGAIGSTTATILAATAQARIVIALKPVVTVSPMPEFIAAGTPVSGPGAIDVAWPSHLEGDIGILVMETANEAVTLSVPAGFVEITNSPQGTGTAGDFFATRLTAYWCRATSAAMGGVTIADPGNHVIAQIFTFRGCIASGNPWDVTAGDVQASINATVQVPGATTTVVNCLVMAICTEAKDSLSAQFSGWTNADLSDLVEIADTRGGDGNGGGFGIAIGGKAAAGAYGVTTATIASATHAVQGRMSIALKPPTGGGGGGGDVSLPHRYWRLRLANTPGAGPEVNQLELTERSSIVAAPLSQITAPSQVHPGITHLRPLFAVNQGSDANAQFDIDVALMTIPAGYVPAIPTDQVTRKVETFYEADGVLLPGVGQGDGAGTLPLIKGLIRGSAAHGQDVVFSDFGRVFQTVPQVTIRGGILYQPASKWGTAAQVDAGTAASAPSSSAPQYEDVAALDLTESGFTCRARLRQKGTGVTLRTLNFAATPLNVLDEVDTIATLTNAPANDDQYTVDYIAQWKMFSKNGLPFRVQMFAVFESSIDSGATWQQRFQLAPSFETVAPGSAPAVATAIGRFTVTIGGLTSDGTDRFRLRFQRFERTGLGIIIVGDASSFIKGQTVTFNTSSDSYASKTPGTDDVIQWEAVGYV